MGILLSSDQGQGESNLKGVVLCSFIWAGFPSENILCIHMKVAFALLIIIFLAFSGYRLTFRHFRLPPFARRFLSYRKRVPSIGTVARTPIPESCGRGNAKRADPFDLSVARLDRATLKLSLKTFCKLKNRPFLRNINHYFI